MLAVSPLRGSSGDEGDGDVGGLAGNFPGDTLLEDINFDDLFGQFNDGYMLPDLQVDPAEIFADISEGREEDSSGMAILGAVESTVVSDGGRQEKGSLEGEMKVEKDGNQGEEVMTMMEDPVAMAAEIRSPSSEVNKGQQSSAVATKNSQGKRKVKVDWTPELHRRFVQAVEQLGVDQAVPSRILELMGIDCLTRHNVASHLQKYRSHQKHLLARGAEAASRCQTRQTYAPNVCTMWNMNPWVAPTIGFPAAPPLPPPFQHFRPFHVWGHSTLEPPLASIWPRHLAPLQSPSPSYWHHHYQSGSRQGWVPQALTQGTHCFLQALPTSFPVPPVPGVLPHPFYRPVPPPATKLSGSQLRPDAYPSNENIDAVIGDVLAKPWLPLPLGLKPPTMESVRVELRRQGVSNVPPTRG